MGSTPTRGRTGRKHYAHLAEPLRLHPISTHHTGWGLPPVLLPRFGVNWSYRVWSYPIGASRDRVCGGGHPAAGRNESAMEPGPIHIFRRDAPRAGGPDGRALACARWLLTIRFAHGRAAMRVCRPYLAYQLQEVWRTFRRERARLARLVIGNEGTTWGPRPDQATTGSEARPVEPSVGLSVIHPHDRVRGVAGSTWSAGPRPGAKPGTELRHGAPAWLVVALGVRRVRLVTMRDHDGARWTLSR